MSDASISADVSRCFILLFVGLFQPCCVHALGEVDPAILYLNHCCLSQLVESLSGYLFVGVNDPTSVV